ncbi:MAG TPA: hypothetical protein VN033_06165 [Vulgatibacter sp.]|nr:hypothetical protein [Vulgatibacter sp.]
MRSRFLFPVFLAAALVACDSKSDDPGVGGAGGAGGIGGNGGTGGTGGTGGVATECGGATVLELDGAASPAVLEGVTDTRDAWDGLCAPDLSYGNDVIVRYRAADTGFFSFSTQGTEYETVLFALEDCQDGFTEITCDHRPGGSRITTWLEEGQTIYLVVDTVGEKVSRPFKLTGGKATERRPTIDEFESFANPDARGSIGVRLTGTNPDGDLVRFAMQLFDASGREILEKPVMVPFAEDSFFMVEQGDGTYVVSGAVSLTGQSPPRIGAIELTLFDENGLWTETVRSTAGAPAVVGLGEECDPRGLFSVCGADGGCVRPDGSAAAHCAGAPRITKLTASKNLVAGTWGVIVEGDDPDGDVAVARVRPRDADDKIVSVGPSGMTEVPFHRLGQDSTGAFRGVIALEARFDAACERPIRKDYDDCVEAGTDPAVCEADRAQALAACLADALERIAKVDVEVVDATGLVAKFATADFSATEEGVLGGVCDPYGAIGYCPASLVCWSEEESVPEICQANGPACPASYGTVDLADHPVAEGWSFSGTLADAELNLEATCGGGGETRVFSFAAPQAGVYSFQTSALGDGVDTVLSLRHFCQLAGYEVACSDDVDGGKASRVELELGAGEAVFALVSAKDEGVAGAFTLSVARADTEPEVVP